MVLFGIGTLPIFIAAWLLFRIKQQIKWRKLLILYKLLPFIIGVLMILRGANLGIPYLSPELEKVNGQTEVNNCCQTKKLK
jgi:sulfite exporter TauE/SafE